MPSKEALPTVIGSGLCQPGEKQNRTEQNSWECEKTGEDTAEQETYGETVVLSAGQLSGTASLVSREP